jgi:hypothetical protein
MDKNITTKDGIVVCVGQQWRDLDKRMRGRTITITKVKSGFAWYGAVPGRYGQHKGRRISISRMHNHSTGFELCS